MFLLEGISFYLIAIKMQEKGLLDELKKRIEVRAKRLHRNFSNQFEKL